MTRNQGTNQRPNFEQVNNDAESRPQGPTVSVGGRIRETSDRDRFLSLLSSIYPLLHSPTPFPFLFLLLHILYLPGTRRDQNKADLELSFLEFKAISWEG